MTKPSISDICELSLAYNSDFNAIIDTAEYKPSGIWYSEAYIFLLLCEYYECQTIIESGRARGVSTDLISRFYHRRERDIEIISIDDRPDSPEAEIAESKLEDRANVELLYGDSTELLPDLIEDEAAVLIDGPKGELAIELAMDVLESTDSPIVAIHDLRKDWFERDLSELVFEHRLYTDNENLVDSFRQYDEAVHAYNQAHHSEETMYGPYCMDGNESASYGPTFGCFFNGKNPVDRRAYQNYQDHMDRSAKAVLGDYLRQQQRTGNVIERVGATTLLKLHRVVQRF